jgi:hypothetical protein
LGITDTLIVVDAQAVFPTSDPSAAWGLVATSTLPALVAKRVCDVVEREVDRRRDVGALTSVEVAAPVEWLGCPARVRRRAVPRREEGRRRLAGHVHRLLEVARRASGRRRSAACVRPGEVAAPVERLVRVGTPVDRLAVGARIVRPVHIGTPVDRLAVGTRIVRPVHLGTPVDRLAVGVPVERPACIGADIAGFVDVAVDPAGTVGLR